MTKKIKNFIGNCKLPAPLRLARLGKIVNSKGGFTIVEMLIYMGILSIMLGILSSVFVNILDTQLESEANSSVEQDRNYIFSRLAYDISRADTIVYPVNLGDQATSLQIVINGISYVYARNPNNNNLEITDNLSTESLNGFDTTVSNLTFQRLGNFGGKNTIKIGFTISSKTKRAGGVETRSFDTTIGTR